MFLYQSDSVPRAEPMKYFPPTSSYCNGVVCGLPDRRPVVVRSRILEPIRGPSPILYAKLGIMLVDFHTDAEFDRPVTDLFSGKFHFMGA